MRIARHALKVLLMFTLLDRQRMPLADIAGVRRARADLPRIQRAVLPAAAGPRWPRC